MVASLALAAAEGRLEDVRAILAQESPVDLEARDEAGNTPLVEAVRNGHSEVVRALLEKGADPSACAEPAQLTSDPVILELLEAAKSKPEGTEAPQVNGYHAEAPGEMPAPYYPSPVPYGYYPPYGYPPAPQQMPDGTTVYPPPPPPFMPPPPGPTGAPGEPQPFPGHGPSPEITKTIPCRFFPACRYGQSCRYFHPPAPYYPPMYPQGQYPPPSFDPMNGSPYGYYPAPPPQFSSPPNGVAPLEQQPPTPLSAQMAPPPQPTDGITSPSAIPPAFIPGAPPAQGVPYAPVPAMSPPNGYAHPGSMPMAMPPPAPVPMPNGVPPPAMYPVPQMNGHAEHGEVPDAPAAAPPVKPHGEGYPHPPPFRDGHHRRGSMRRPSLASRKPPCMFFPAGRCKNGDDCRFPHVLPDGSGPGMHARVGPRPRPHSFGNGLNGIEERMGAMQLRENGAPNGNGHVDNRRFSGPKQMNGFRGGRAPVMKQRLPNADEFPVLGGGSPNRSAGPASPAANGPTAAQVLQAPAPFRPAAKDTPKTAESTQPSQQASKAPTETQGSTRSDSPEIICKPLPISFAAAAAAPDAAKEVQVSA
ncbi:hypothetical protein K525DRAFT_281572 [Schizophyllum commune Loenen D]|nr:hypothetical protein K525DRAFT_281572 [Schizophyllum commune Loenen D]